MSRVSGRRINAVSHECAYYNCAHATLVRACAFASRARLETRSHSFSTRFPGVLPAMVDKCRAHMRSEVLSHSHFQEPSAPTASERNVTLMQILYVERAHTLFAPEGVLAWLQVRSSWGDGG